MRHRAIPMPMPGGRAQPGSSIRRPGAPGTAHPPPASPNTSFAPAHTPIHPGFEFNLNFDIPTAPRYPSPSYPVPLPHQPGGQEQGHVRNPAAPTEHDHRPSATALTPQGGLYGQAYLVGRGRFHFDPTERFDDWLHDLANLSLDREDSDSAKPRRGAKRKSHFDDNDETMDLSQPMAKRSRFASTIRRTVSHLSRGKRFISRLSPVYERPSSAPTVVASACRHVSDDAAGPRSRSVLSRAGFGPARASPEPRTVKICLVGDSGAGKTAFVNFLLNGSHVETEPSTAPTIHRAASVTANGTVVRAELWDFPGTIAEQRNGPLASNFFHAAIICFSVEDVANVNAIKDTWAPKLRASLHEGKVFVLGLKRDLRPDFPALDLSLLPSKEPVSWDTGSEAATEIHAAVYAECSVKEGDNVPDVWNGFVNYLVASIERHEEECIKMRRGEKAKEAVAAALDTFGLARLGSKLGMN